MGVRFVSEKTYVRIQRGIVAEFLTTDLDISTISPPDVIWIDITNIPGVQYGWVATLTDGVWSLAPYVPPPPTPEEILAAVISDRGERIRWAHDRLMMSSLQYIVDLGIATSDEVALLDAWKQYCVDLSRIDMQAGFPGSVTWPTLPTTDYDRM